MFLELETLRDSTPSYSSSIRWISKWKCHIYYLCNFCIRTRYPGKRKDWRKASKVKFFKENKLHRNILRILLIIHRSFADKILMLFANLSLWIIYLLLQLLNSFWSWWYHLINSRLTPTFLNFISFSIFFIFYFLFITIIFI